LQFCTWAAPTVRRNLLVGSIVRVEETFGTNASNYSRRMRWAEHVARIRWGKVVYRVLVEEFERKRTPGIPRRR
jgi:hypothetical protein